VSHAETTVLPSIVVPHAAQDHIDLERVWTIVVAGGSGARFGRPKQYEQVGDRRMIDRSVATAVGVSQGVVVVVPHADVAQESQTFAPSATVVAGGASRSDSVRAGLAAVDADATIVCVHDAARPFATAQLYRSVIAAVAAGADGVVPGVPVTDTIKLVADDRSVEATPPRHRLVAVQTPQGFRAGVLRAAHATGVDGTDDAALVEAVGGRVVVVDGEANNRKVTLPDDLQWARTLVAQR
jgi:2-C-methyl-D-erythritol 4-phosphate cytidylyltransferase